MGEVERRNERGRGREWVKRMRRIFIFDGQWLEFYFSGHGEQLGSA